MRSILAVYVFFGLEVLQCVSSLCYLAPSPSPLLMRLKADGVGVHHWVCVRWRDASTQWKWRTWWIRKSRPSLGRNVVVSRGSKHHVSRVSKHQRCVSRGSAPNNNKKNDKKADSRGVVKSVLAVTIATLPNTENEPGLFRFSDFFFLIFNNF